MLYAYCNLYTCVIVFRYMNIYMYMYMCIYMYIYIYIYIYVCVIFPSAPCSIELKLRPQGTSGFLRAT